MAVRKNFYYFNEQPFANIIKKHNTKTQTFLILQFLEQISDLPGLLPQNTHRHEGILHSDFFR